MSKQRYTPEQWSQIQPALWHMTGRGIEIARLVMVEGLKGAEVARRYDTTPQNVSQMVAKARKALEETQVAGWVPSVVWLPQELADKLATLDKEKLAALINAAINEGS